MHDAIFKQAELESAGASSRFLYRNFAGGTLEAGDDGA
jgi:PqqA peptide cyclase